MRRRSSSSPSWVILGNVRSAAAGMDVSLLRISSDGPLALAQHLAVDLAGGRLGQFGHKSHEAWIFVMAEAPANEILDLVLEGLVAGSVSDDEGFHHLATQRIGHANGRRLADFGMLQDGILDLHRAHGPAGGDDHVVGATTMRSEEHTSELQS